MKTREHIYGGVRSVVTYSECEKFRYRLERFWMALTTHRKVLTLTMLNPSTATELQNDPTVERCQRRAESGPYCGVRILNLFAFRATDPRDMKKALDPIGRDNNAFIEEAIEHADHDGDLLCAWGTHGSFMQRDKQVLNIFRNAGVNPMALRITKGGFPAHPLYLPYALKPVAMRSNK